MKNKKKVIISIFSIIALSLIISISYSFYTKVITGTNNNVSITGDIYMKYNGSNVITNTNLRPMTKEEALERDDNVFEFTITGKNQSSKDLYYGISLENLGTFNDQDIVVYLEEIVGNNENPKVLLDGIRFNSLDNHVYVSYISKGTNSEVTKTYQLRVWLRDGIIVSDTENDADYTSLEWSNALMSLKVNVDGNMSKMNMPLYVDSNSYVENNVQYIFASIKNYENPTEENELLDVNDTMRLEVSAPNTVFTYRDSLGNEETVESNNLDLTYTLNKKTNVDLQIFMKPANDITTNTDVSVKLTKNGTIVYEIIHNIELLGGNFCLSNGFTNLYDCILVSEHLSSSVSDAKTYINNKGNISTGDTAPSYTYVEQSVANSQYNGTTGYKWYVADSYTFNKKTGYYTLVNRDGSSIKQVDLSNDYVGYYTTGTTNQGTTSPNLYKIESIAGEQSIMSTRYTYKINSSLDSQVGLYKTVDDYGDSYIYRGAVSNNNVSFGGYNWKIIRTNGESTNQTPSIRMIYDGASNSQIAKNVYNLQPGGATYVGYMYNEENTSWESAETYHGAFVSDTTYYFADDYETGVDNDGVTYFKLKTTTNPMVSKKISELSSSQITLTPYTCKMTTAEEICRVLYKVISVTSDTQARVKVISYQPQTLADTVLNIKDSLVKKQIDNWYLTNFSIKTNNGSPVTDYIVDNTFCNNRYITDSTNNSGYSLTSNTWYIGRSNLVNSDPPIASLLCHNLNDRFSMTNAKGNAKLTYPVALITADELALAGAKYNTLNNNFYLRFNQHYWTMTPDRYQYGSAIATVFVLYNSGSLMPRQVSDDRGLTRENNQVYPVINIRGDVTIISGNGSINNPFQISLNN